jgi:hypothetical protein
MPVVSVQKSVICDDVRIEYNGKYILIGVYAGNNIGIPIVPANVQFSCYIEIVTELSRILDGEFRVVDENMEVKVSGRLKIHLFPDAPVPIHFLHLAFAIKKDGKFTLQWNLDNSQWEEVTSVRVEVRPPPSNLAALLAPPA